MEQLSLSDKMLPLTFNFKTYKDILDRYERVSTIRPFKDNQIKLFLMLLLRAGVVSYIEGEEEVLLECFINSGNDVCMTGLTNKVIGDQFYISLYRKDEDNVWSSLNDIYVQIGIQRLYSPEQKYKNYAKWSRHTDIGVIKVDLNRYNIPKDFLTEDKLPLYLNHPILGIYAKEKLEGTI